MKIRHYACQDCKVERPMLAPTVIHTNVNNQMNHTDATACIPCNCTSTPDTKTRSQEQHIVIQCAAHPQILVSTVTDHGNLTSQSRLQAVEKLTRVVTMSMHNQTTNAPSNNYILIYKSAQISRATRRKCGRCRIARYHNRVSKHSGDCGLF